MRVANNLQKQQDNESKQFLKPVKPSAAIISDYQRRLDKMVRDMQASGKYWVNYWYRQFNPNLIDLQNQIPSKKINPLIVGLGIYWLKKFNDFANKYSPKYADKVADYTDITLKNNLKSAGHNVNLQNNRTRQDIVSSIIDENVSLIKSIPSKYFDAISFIVNQGYQNGKDEDYIAEELQKRYGITKRRAKMIASDQTHKATAALNRFRQLELGIKEAEWLYTYRSKTERLDHVRANGKKFDIEEGCLISGEYIQPGQLINCKCLSKPLLPINF